MICLLLASCGQSYEEKRRATREQQRRQWRQDSAALKVAVMPTLDCLPLYIAKEHGLFEKQGIDVRLKRYTAQMDCDTAVERGRVEGLVSDLVRTERMQQRGTPLRYVAATDAYWQLVTNRQARIRELKQLDDKMVAMTRYSITDLMTDRAIDSVKLERDRVYKVQINDVDVRLLMLQNNEIDALWLTEPQATVARTMKHPVVLDTRSLGLQLGVLVFNEQEMRRQARGKQFDLFMKAYNQACDSISKHGLRHYRNLIVKKCGIKEAMADSLPDNIKYERARGLRQQDIDAVEKWLGGR